VVYSSTDKFVKFYVNQQLKVTKTASNAGSADFVPATLDSPRIGSWLDPDGNVARSLHGQISVFRCARMSLGYRTGRLRT
jgi:hypothetical protein